MFRKPRWDHEARNQLLQERIDFQAEQLKENRDALAEWRRLYKQRFDMLKGELSALNGWVATIAASHNLPLPQNIDPASLVFGDNDDDGLGTPSNYPDPMADLTLANLLGETPPAPVAVDGDDGGDDEQHAGP